MELSKKRYKPIPKDLENELVIKAKNGDKVAENKVMNTNMRYASKMALKYSTNTPYDVTYSGALQGMAEAWMKFDPTKGVKYYTYATHYIKSYILKAINEWHNNEDVLVYGEQIIDNNDDNKQMGAIEDIFDIYTLTECLNVQEKDILYSLYAIDRPQQSLRELGQKYGVSKSTMCQKYKKIIKKIQKENGININI